MSQQTITVSTSVSALLSKVWETWTNPKHIMNWNFASDEWKCPRVINDLKPKGKFSWRMEAKDGSMGFDYAGSYLKVDNLQSIEKQLEDGRKIHISFSEKEGFTEVIETFEPDENNPELQRQGWQAILNNFKSYTERY